jgi:hypothetical protein
MSNGTKLFIIACCAALCAGAPIFVRTGASTNPRAKSQVQPVNNQQSQRARWVQV